MNPTKHESLNSLASAIPIPTKIPNGIPLFLVPAVAHNPPPSPLHDALTTAQELLRELIAKTDDRNRAWTNNDWAEMAKVAAKTNALFNALDKSIRELKRYQKTAATTKLQRSQIRRIEKLVTNLRKAREDLKGVKESEKDLNDTFRTGVLGQPGHKMGL